MCTDSLAVEQVLAKFLRHYLIVCHRMVAEEYPEIRNMEPDKAADFLLYLQKTGRIEIELYDKAPNLLGCRITERDAERDSNAVP